jgi:hypothetical protein
MILSERTLKRILKGTHSPTYHTILKVYRYLIGTNNDRETVVKMPNLLSENVLKDAENFSIANQEAQFFSEIGFFLKADSVFRSIYIETACGELHRDKVGFEHGNHGLKTLDNMLKMEVIKEIQPSVYSASRKRGIIDGECAHQISRFLLDYKFNPEKSNSSGENFYQVVFDGVDKETYNDLLKIDWEAKEKRLEILKNAKKGDVKFWTISYTDTLSSSFIYDEEKELLQ